MNKISQQSQSSSHFTIRKSLRITIDETSEGLRVLKRLKGVLKKHEDASLFAVVFLLLMGTTVYYNWPIPQHNNLTFGWEYGFIAEAVSKGQGFANPFGQKSGPTAWMPPILVFVQATIFSLYGVKSIASVWVMLLLKCEAISCSLLFLLHSVNKSTFKQYKYWLIPLFLVPIYLDTV